MTKQKDNKEKWPITDKRLGQSLPPHEIQVSSLLLSQAFNTLSKALEKAIQPVGVTVSQYVTLWALYRSTQPLTPTEVSRLLPIEPQSVTALLDRLQERNLIARRRSSRDRRSVRITLTAKGKELLMLISPSVGQVMVDIFGSLSIEEHQLLDSLARKIRNASIAWLGVNPDHLDTAIERLSGEMGELNRSQRNSQGKGVIAGS